MTMLHISEAELVPISTADFRALRQRLFDGAAAKAIADRVALEKRQAAEAKARAEAAEQALRDDEARAERMRLEAAIEATRVRSAELMAELEITPTRPPPVTTARKIQNQICRKYGITFAELIGQGKLLAFTVPRLEAYYRLTTECPHLSFSDIGRRMGGRDHGTIHHGVKVYCHRNGLARPMRLPPRPVPDYMARIASVNRMLEWSRR